VWNYSSEFFINEQNMENNYVYVVSENGQPLMPTKRFGKVKKLLKAGLAKVIRRKPFTIQLLYDTTSYTQPLIMGIDPGGKDIALVVRKENGEVVFAAHVEARSKEVSENMAERRMHRQSRRRHRRLVRKRRAKKAQTYFGEKRYKISNTAENLLCKGIKPKPIRFHNRRRNRGWLTPTASHLLETHKRFSDKAAKILPIAHVHLEYGKFDIHKLDNPSVQGVQYQNGRKKGYANSQEYVLCRDKHTCQLCGNTKGNLHVHHVIWASQKGGDNPENLITLCAKCHEKVHRHEKVDAQVKAVFAGMCKKYVHTTILNTIMPLFYEWLMQIVSTVCLTYGYETKEKRQNLGLPKSHCIDAYLVSFSDEDKIGSIKSSDLIVYEYKQFRRHHRQLIHATRERNYKDGTKIVAKNRNKRTGQKSDSLTELVAKKGKQILARLRVLPGKKVIRSGYDELRKGDVVRYKGTYCVIKGYGEMGMRVGFAMQKDYVPSKECSLVLQNAGMVCL
jgi:hypothetical protein